MAWSRRRVLASAGGLFALCAASAPVFGEVVPRTAEEARQTGWLVVTDHGAVGDGRSRRLRDRYPDLAAARRDFPAATDLDAELDGAAIQRLADTGAPRIFYPPGHYRHSAALVVHSRQRHLGSGPATFLENVRPRRTPYDWTQAHSFQIGDIHPVAMLADRPEVAWAVRRLDPVPAGATTVTLREPLGAAAVQVGDVVMIRCDNPPFVDGEGHTYDFEMWNQVVGRDPAGGRLDLADPVPRAIAATGAPTDLYGPTLCVNAGRDTFLGAPWSIAQDVEVGAMTLDSAGFTARNGVWRGWFHDLTLTAEHMLTFNALVHSTVERVTGTWSARMLEVKQASRASVVRDVRGVYRPGDNTIAPVMPAISVGEQSFDCTLDGVSVSIGPECTAAVRALELNSSGLRFRGLLDHRGTGAISEVWVVKESNGPASPPTGLDLDLTVRTRAGLRSYGLIGNVADRVSDPDGVLLRLDQRSDGAPAQYALVVDRGRDVRVLRNEGDSLLALVSLLAQAPLGIPLA